MSSQYHQVVIPKRLAPTGFITTTTVLVATAVLLIVGVSSSLLSIDAGQLLVAGEQVQQTDSALDTCIENALLEFNRLKTVPAAQTLPSGASCVSTINTQSQTSDEITMTFTTTATASAYTAAARVTAVRSDTVDVTAWEEIVAP